MTTTQQEIGVGQPPAQTVEEVAEVLTGMSLSLRAMWLPKSANGRDPIPHSDPAACDISRDMGAGKSQPWKHIMRKKLCDQKDGVPTEALVADLDYAIAVLRSRAPTFRVDRPMGALNAAETKAQARLDLAQFRLAEQPDDPMALREARDAWAHYATVFGELGASYNHRLTVTRGAASRRPIRRRRAGLALHA